MGLPSIPAGVYRHYKGPLYLILGYGHDSNAEDLWVANEPGAYEPYSRLGERDVVVYVGLQLDTAKPGPRLAVRTASDFLATINPSTGTQCPGGVICDTDPCVPRFTYVGPTYTPAPVPDSEPDRA